MSATSQGAADHALGTNENKRLAKAKVKESRKLQKSYEARKFLMKRQLKRGGLGQNGMYKLQARGPDGQEPGTVAKADGRLRTVWDMVDYQYAFMPGYYSEDTNLDKLAKQDDPITSTSGSPAYTNTMYGTEVYSVINSEANIWGMLEKRAWTRSGVRVVKNHGHTLGSGGLGEQPDTLPETDHPDLDSFDLEPTRIAHNFDTSLTEQLLAGTEDDHFANDPFDWLRRWFGTGTEHQTGQGAHPKHINVQLGSKATRDESTDSTFEHAMAPLDRLIASSDEESNVGAISDGDLDLYTSGDGGIDRTNDTWFDANVFHNGGTNRSFYVELMDNAITGVKNASGKDPLTDENYFWLTDHDTAQVIEQEVSTKERLEPVRTTVGMNGVQTRPGDDVGIMVQSYKDIPIFQTEDVPQDGIGRIFLVDSSTLFIKQLMPTQFYSAGIEQSGDPFVLDTLGDEGMFLTVGESCITNPAANAKIRDIK